MLNDLPPLLRRFDHCRGRCWFWASADRECCEWFCCCWPFELFDGALDWMFNVFIIIFVARHRHRPICVRTPNRQPNANSVASIRNGNATDMVEGESEREEGNNLVLILFARACGRWRRRIRRRRRTFIKANKANYPIDFIQFLTFSIRSTSFSRSLRFAGLVAGVVHFGSCERTSFLRWRLQTAVFWSACCGICRNSAFVWIFLASMGTESSIMRKMS